MLWEFELSFIWGNMSIAEQEKQNLRQLKKLLSEWGKVNKYVQFCWREYMQSEQVYLQDDSIGLGRKLVKQSCWGSILVFLR